MKSGWKLSLLQVHMHREQLMMTILGTGGGSMRQMTREREREREGLVARTLISRLKLPDSQKNKELITHDLQPILESSRYKSRCYLHSSTLLPEIPS